MLGTYVASYVPKPRTLRKPVPARRALSRRKKILVLAMALGLAAALALLLVGCGGGRSSVVVTPPPTPAVQPLQIADVQKIVQAAVNSVNIDLVVAVVHPAGFRLGCDPPPNPPRTAHRNLRA